MSSELGKFIKFKRGNKSLREFANYLEISHAYLDSLEKGVDPKTKKEINISTDLLTRLSKKLDVSVECLLSMISGTDYHTAIHTYDINPFVDNDLPNVSEEEIFKLFEESEEEEQKLIASEKGYIYNAAQKEFEKYFHQNKNLLTEEDREYIKFIIEQRRKKINIESDE